MISKYKHFISKVGSLNETITEDLVLINGGNQSRATESGNRRLLSVAWVRPGSRKGFTVITLLPGTTNTQAGEKEGKLILTLDYTNTLISSI